MLSDSEIDVFAINESKIDNSVKDSEISIPGYNMIRRDRNRLGVEWLFIFERYIPSMSGRI